MEGLPSRTALEFGGKRGEGGGRTSQLWQLLAQSLFPGLPPVGRSGFVALPFGQGNEPVRKECTPPFRSLYLPLSFFSLSLSFIPSRSFSQGSHRASCEIRNRQPNSGDFNERNCLCLLRVWCTLHIHQTTFRQLTTPPHHPNKKR